MIKLRAEQKAIIRTYRRIVQGWRVPGSQILTLIGDPDEFEFEGWATGSGAPIPSDTLERISYVFGIYKALRILFPDEQRANAWPRKPNRYFEERPALDVMLDGDLARVRCYLDAQCQ
ncbi:MbcA/ParS/Xre antitoxin family protein [Marinobacter orientalis]|uniref:DUF2384 domain-containing protein n=1 Tax=Marinobacter orientalis TaxID=1928859 RepID=A0A7Y0WS50_9GAMM|nr:MbcA/ParS/Xre antitoxin family protein [Marinobacter orientalis]NMT63477.1 DUF2384 domain-containing protein [Marinobacter orientalis]TGX48538.1 DUF2384 domain-containing protein [Marinobacter orientalis]